MKWRSQQSVLGYWSVALVADDGSQLGSASVNQFGRVRFFCKPYPSPLGSWFPDRRQLDVAADRARANCSPTGQSGRYSTRSSKKRGEIAEMIAAALNHATVFPAPSVSAER